MNVEWIITGVLLLGGMAAGGIHLYVKRKRESNLDENDTLPES